MRRRPEQALIRPSPGLEPRAWRPKTKLITKAKPDLGDRMAPILLRYADADASYGEHLLTTLTQAGLKVSAAPAPATRQRSAAEAQASQAVVVLWSRQALRSPALLLQAAMAKAQGKLVAARIEPGVAPLGDAALVDLTDWRRGLADLTAHLQPTAPAPGAAAAIRPASAKSAPYAAAPAQWSEPKIQNAPPKKSSAGLWIALILAAAAVAAGLAFTGQLG